MSQVPFGQMNDWLRCVLEQQSGHSSFRNPNSAVGTGTMLCFTRHFNPFVKVNWYCTTVCMHITYQRIIFHSAWLMGCMGPLRGAEPDLLVGNWGWPGLKGAFSLFNTTLSTRRLCLNEKNMPPPGRNPSSALVTPGLNPQFLT